MNTLRGKRHRTTEKAVPRATRDSSTHPTQPRAPAPDRATTIRDMPSAPRAPRQAEAITLELKRPSELPPAIRSSVAPAVHARPVLPAPLNATADRDAARYSVIPPRLPLKARFATLARYLEALPSGLESYPAVRTKGAIVRQLLLDPVHPLSLSEGLPRRLEELICTPPSANEWVPLVELCALHAAAFDFAFADKGGVPAYEEWTFQRDLQLLKGPLYRALIAVRRPERLLTNHAARWSAFHRGSSLHVMAVADGKIAVRLSYPPYSWPKVSRVALGAAFRAAVIVAGAQWGEVTSKEESISLSSFDIQWR
jgi:hypothetical protein